MTPETKTPVRGGTGATACSTGLTNDPQYSRLGLDYHRVLQAVRLRHRFGLPPRRADLVASLAYGGAHHA